METCKFRVVILVALVLEVIKITLLNLNASDNSLGILELYTDKSYYTYITYRFLWFVIY